MLLGDSFRGPAFLRLLWNGTFQNFCPFYGSIYINGAVITGIIATGFRCLSGFITGFVRGIVSGAIIFCVTVKDIPAWCQLEQPSEAGQCKTLIMDQMGNLPYLSDIEIGVNTVIGPGFPSRVHQAHFFVLAYGLLGEIHFPGYGTDEIP